LKKQLKYIIIKITKGLGNLCTKTKEIEDYSIYTSILIAIISLKYMKTKDISNITDKNYLEILKEEFILLEKRFPELINTFYKIDSYFKDELIKQELFYLISKLFSKTDENIDNIISWMYQYIKYDLERSAFKKDKKEHKDLLYTTQFFTDNYMVKYIVDKSLEQIDITKIESINIIDCASGGGNFLTYSFEKLFNLIKIIKSNWSNNQTVDYILNNIILGYDLDNNLSKIASLSLFVKACNYAIPSETTNINIFGGYDTDKFGFLNNNILSNVIDNNTFISKLNQSKELNKIRIFLTNPPFMGKRDMDIELKNYLLNMYPDCKGDLCISFIQKINNEMNDNDIFGVVSQNNWMFLSSLSKFRKKFLLEKTLLDCVDLGTNAFEDISGEKTSVALFVISNKCENKLTNFFDLKDLRIIQKKDALSIDLRGKDSFLIDQKKFLENKNYELNYRLKIGFDDILKLPTYSDYAKPMQGTSTGDNKKFIKYIWEINGNNDWVSVSKGGGFCKWLGLNYFMVYWGENANKIKENSGSALRNIDKIALTDLVYSDTGTLGLNVRLLNKNQVFIASGPGIIIKSGNKYAHLAFLNSKTATFLLKVINPKFTISAGYISKINIANNILDSEYIINKSIKCLEIKEKLLARKLPNKEFKHLEYKNVINIEQTISDLIIEDLRLEYKLLELELQIENKIMHQYNFSLKQKNEMIEIVGKSCFSYIKSISNLSIEKIDKLSTSLINVNCMPIAKTVGKYTNGTAYLLEQLSFKILKNPETILHYIESNIISFHNLRKKYLLDFIHKIIIFELNITSLMLFSFKEINIENLKRDVLDKYEFLKKINDFDNYFYHILYVHHKNSLFNKPIFSIINDTLVRKGITSE